MYDSATAAPATNNSSTDAMYDIANCVGDGVATYDIAVPASGKPDQQVAYDLAAAPTIFDTAAAAPPLSSASAGSDPTYEQSVPPSLSNEPDYEAILDPQVETAYEAQLSLRSEDGFSNVEGAYDMRTLAGGGTPVAAQVTGISHDSQTGSVYTGFAELEAESSELMFEAVAAPEPM